MDADSDADAPLASIGKGKNPYLVDTCLLCRCRRTASQETGSNICMAINMISSVFYFQVTFNIDVHVPSIRSQWRCRTATFVGVR